MRVSNNQKIITYHNDFRRWSNPKQMYFTLGVEDVLRANNTLSRCGMGLWLFLAKNKDENVFPLSKVDVANQTWIKGNTYDNAVKELKEKGYLQKTGEGRIQNKHVEYYTFCVAPAPDPAEDSPRNEGIPVADPVAYPAKDSPTDEGIPVADPVVDPAEDSPTDEGIPVADPVEMMQLSEIHEKLNVINDAINAVCYKTHGVRYNGWQMLSRKAVEDEITNRGIYIDSWMKKRLDDNCNLKNGTDETQQVIESLPF